MDYKALATTIVDLVGGKANVKSVVHCATRLRFTLVDTAKANTDKLKKTKGILSVINAGGQYQIVIGPDVPQVYQEVVAVGGFDSLAAIKDEAAEKEDNRSKFSKILEAIASIFQPIIPAITGAGLLKALMALFSVVGWLKGGTKTYIILNAMADSAFYYLPILLACSAAKRFKCNPYTSAALGGLLVYPGFINMVNASKKAGEAIKFLGFLPVTPASYASSVIPIILGVWFMSYVEHFMQKVSPKAIKFFSVPLVSLFVGGTVTLVVLGPLGTWVSNIINIFFKWLNATAPWFVPTLVGAVSPLLVMTGTHYGLIPIGTSNLATLKWDTVVGPGMLVSNTAQGAAGLAMAIKSKNKDTKQLASSAGLTGLLGITEPVLYGINLRFTFPLYAAMIGGGIGGLYLGIFRVARFAAGSPGLLVLPAYIPNADVAALGYTMANLVNAIIGIIIACAISFACTWVFYDIWKKNGKLDPSEMEDAEEAPAVEAAPAVADDALVAVADSEMIDITTVKDETFSSKAMGDGVAFILNSDKVCAPCNGTLSAVFPTGHAFGVTRPDGVELLVHIGINTVELDGKGFKIIKQAGETVKAGEPVIKLDMDSLKKSGYDLTTMLIVTETNGKEVKFASTGAKKCGEVIA